MYLALLHQYSTWVLIGLGIALAISIVAFILAYRKAKQAPYFLWRQEAARRARRLLAVILILLLAAGGTIWVQRNGPATPETLSRAPSPTATPGANDAQASEPLPSSQPTAIQAGLTRAATDGDAAPVETVAPSATPTATPAPSRTPTAAPVSSNGQAELEFVTFARDVAEGNQPVGPASEFTSTPGPIYAFFKYTNLSNGTEWTFSWSRDTVDLTRETQPWEWGAYGQAYLFFEPPGGYEPGEYLLQVMLEDQVTISETFTID